MAVCIIISVLSFYVSIYLFEKTNYGYTEFWGTGRAIVCVVLGAAIGGMAGVSMESGSISVGLVLWLLFPLWIFCVYFLWLFFSMDGKELSCTIGAIEWRYTICGMFPTEVRIVGCRRIAPGNEIVIPSSISSKNVVAVGEKVFMGQDEMKSIEFELSNLHTIGDKAFYGCSNLLTITIPSGVRDIGNEAFKNCSKLREIDWNVSDYNDCRIGSQAFAGCLCLETFTVPNGCAVEEGAFENCPRLKSVSIPQSLEGKTENWGLVEKCKITIRDDEIFIAVRDFAKKNEHHQSMEVAAAYRLLGVSRTDSLLIIRKAYLENLDKAAGFLQHNKALAETMMAETNAAWKAIEENSQKEEK